MILSLRKAARRNLRQTLIVAVAVCGSAMLTGPAHADIILSNLPGVGTGTGTNLGLGIDAFDRTKSVGLTMGASNMQFDSMVALISNGTPNSVLSGGIYDDAAGNPGALLAAFTPVNVAASAAVGEVSITTGASFTLLANTTYWFVLDGPTTTNSLLWQTLNPNTAPTPAAGITFVGYRFSNNGGATWGSSSLFNGMTINASVPGPASLCMLALAGLMGGTRRRRR